MHRRAELAAYLLVVAVAGGMASSGATDALGLGLSVTAVVLAALLAPRAGGWSSFVAVPLLLAVAWMVTTGVARSGWTTASLRVPALVAGAVLAAAVARRLDTSSLELVLRSFVVLGVFHALFVLAQSTALLPDNIDPLRAGSTLDNPNALGILLVAYGVVTAREIARSPRRWLVAALAVQAAAVLLTGSRLALIVALVVLVWQVARTRRLLLPTAPFAALAVVVLGVRFGQYPEPRPRLWLASLDRVLERPWLGWGPEPHLLTNGLPNLRPTTHAHNELLEIALEYGLVGLVLASAALAIWLVSRRTDDAWLAAAALSLAASGLGDISLRFTPVALSLGILAGAATSRPQTASPQGSSARPFGLPPANRAHAEV